MASAEPYSPEDLGSFLIFANDARLPTLRRPIIIVTWLDASSYYLLSVCLSVTVYVSP